jgi:uncharacterized cysteine cluster protein YcgN (CxxCxxCC family)
MTAIDPGSELCVGCGMCCSGVLYDRAKVAPGEEPSMVAAGLDLFDEGDKRFFRLPCPQLNCTRCMIYETRFTICRTFQCALLRRVERREVSLPEAQAKVATALQLLGRVTTINTEARTAHGRIGVRARLAEEVRSGSSADRRASSRRLLDVIALDTFLERWFRLKREKSEIAEDQAAAAADRENLRSHD